MKFASLLQNAESESCSVVSNSLQLRVLYSPWESPGQNTEVWVATPFSRGSSQPRDWTQVSRIAGGFFFYQLSHKGSPRILEWVTCPFPSGSSNPAIEPGSPVLQTDSLPTELPGKPLLQNAGMWQSAVVYFLVFSVK